MVSVPSNSVENHYTDVDDLANNLDGLQLEMTKVDEGKLVLQFQQLNLTLHTSKRVQHEMRQHISYS